MRSNYVPMSGLALVAAALCMQGCKSDANTPSSAPGTAGQVTAAGGLSGTGGNGGARSGGEGGIGLTGGSPAVGGNSVGGNSVGGNSAGGNSAGGAGSTAFFTPLDNFNAHGDQITRFDTDGNAVDAHDGRIALFDGVYYLYGTSYACGFEWQSPGTPFCGFKAYSSTDLVHWKSLGFLFDATSSVWQSRCNGSTTGCFRPHVIFNQATQAYVLWINVYDNTADYRVFTSSSPAGPFVEGPVPTLANGAPGAINHGDQGLFVDDDRTAYLVYTNWTAGGSIAIEQLDASYLTGTGKQALGLTAGNTEAPALFKRNGTYYVTYSDPTCPYCTGTGLSYVTASSPLGPWSAGTKINSNSCGGQPSFVSMLTLGTTTTYLFGSDLWNGKHNEATANFYWAPLTFSATGAIDPVVCQPTVKVQAVSAGAQAPAPAGEDNSSGVAGFTSWCDITATSMQRLQSFTATRSGVLSRVSFTSFQSGNPSSDLELSIYSADPSFLPTGTPLTKILVPRSKVSWAPDQVTVTPNVPVASGGHYAIVLASATTVGCYGMEYADDAPLVGGAEGYSANHGATFTLEAKRTLKFETVIGTAGVPDPAPSTLAILDATYGTGCEPPNGSAAAGNHTSSLTAACNGHPAPCTFPATGTLLGVSGDPSTKCQKDWIAHYTCNGGPTKTIALCTGPSAPACEAGGLRATLVCP